MTHCVKLLRHLDCFGYILIRVGDAPLAFEHELKVAAVADNVEPASQRQGHEHKFECGTRVLDLVLHRLCPVEEYNELFCVPVALFAAPNRELLRRLGGLEGLHRAAQVVDALFLVLIVDVVLGVDSL